MRNYFKIGMLATALMLVGSAHAVRVQDFQKAIHKRGVVVVEYWAPWCGNCRVFKPEYNLAKRSFGKGVRFIEVNVNSVDDVESTFGLKYGLPTLALFKNGIEVSKLPGGGSAAEVVEWIKKYR